MAGRVLAETVAAPARIDWPASLKEAGLRPWSRSSCACL